MPSETYLRLRAAASLLNGYAGENTRFAFDEKNGYYSITMENRSENRPVYSETDKIKTKNPTPEQVAYVVGQSLYEAHPSFAKDVTLDLQNKKDYATN